MSSMSALMSELWASNQALFDVVQTSAQRVREAGAKANDFLLGNPHDPPIPELAQLLAKWSEPGNNDWFAYKMNEPEATSVVAASLRRSHGLPFADSDIAMTTGAFAGLTMSLRTLVSPGDEVIYFLPPWFLYEAMIVAAGGTPVALPVDAALNLDLGAIERAITSRTRAVILNSPHNPTGVMYPPETLSALASILTEAERQHGQPITLISDEAYNRIVYDGAQFHSPVAYYSRSLLVYTYGKTLLAPGQRIGYVAIPPDHPEREAMFAGLLMAAVINGYTFPNAVMQRALGELDGLSVDIPRLQRRRDRMVAGLREAGYELHVPQGTFYLLPKSPIPDDVEFCERLARRDVFVLPGSTCGIPGRFRISLTANDEMVERALPVFAEVAAEVRTPSTTARIGS